MTLVHVNGLKELSGFIYIYIYINNTLDDFINHHVMGWWNFPLTWFRTKLSNNFSFKQSEWLFGILGTQ